MAKKTIWIKMFVLSFLLVIASCLFGLILHYFDQAFTQLFSWSTQPIIFLIIFLIALYLLLITASIVAVLLPVRAGIITFFVSALVLFLGWSISWSHFLLVILYFFGAIIFILLVKHRLSLFIKFSTEAITKHLKIIWIILALMLSLAIYTNMSTWANANEITVSDKYLEQIITPLEKQMFSQLSPEDKNQASQQLKSQIIDFINDLLNNKIKPYQDYIILAIVFNLFAYLILLIRLFAILVGPLLYLTFSFLRLIKITAIITAAKDTEKLVITK